jgi:GNAT superfamily N-acetyltransferase
MSFSVRPALPEDARQAAEVLRAAFAGESELFPEPAGITPGGFEVTLQTGHRVLVAESGARIVGVVRLWDEEGIGWFDWLAAGVTGAGRALLRAVEVAMQDAGIRLLRAQAPADGAVADYLERLGYRTVGLGEVNGQAFVTVERRLPLLTVREQRRADADAIGEIAAIDPWPLAQENRSGWFVLSDGDRVVGVVWVKDAGGGVAMVSDPVLLPEYRGRGLELWMIERSTTYAETRGFHTGELVASAALDGLKRELEDRRWFREGAVYRKALGDRPRSVFEQDD